MRKHSTLETFFAVQKKVDTNLNENANRADYGRWQDVQRLFGIKRGILYRLISERKIKSISLREPGKRFGCRLIYLPSVKAYLDGLLAAQCPENPPISPSPSVGGLGERD